MAKKSLLQLGLFRNHDDVVDVAFPYFGGIKSEYFEGVALMMMFSFINCQQNALLLPMAKKNMSLPFYDLLLANYGVDRGLNDENCATNYDEIKAYSPAWAEQVTGLAVKILSALHEFADNEKTHGRSMVIVGAGINHWYHMDMTYRGIINMLIFCGCIGQSGGGWAHYGTRKTASTNRLVAVSFWSGLAASTSVI